jgi:hypothetical protein
MNHGIKKLTVAQMRKVSEGKAIKLTKKQVENLDGGMSGGKVNRLHKFDRIYKSIAQKVKPLNKNLSGIKHALQNKAISEIDNYDSNPYDAETIRSEYDTLAGNGIHKRKKRRRGSGVSNGLIKGSPEAKARMAKLRNMKRGGALRPAGY